MAKTANPDAHASRLNLRRSGKLSAMAKTAAAQALIAALDEGLAHAARATGQELVWSAQERDIIMLATMRPRKPANFRENP